MKQISKNNDRFQKKNTKQKDQAHLSKYFPNLGQAKSNNYQSVIHKANAILNQQKRLVKQILKEQNQIIKETNNLYKKIFKEADHEFINQLAQLFLYSKQPNIQNHLKQTSFNAQTNTQKLKQQNPIISIVSLNSTQKHQQSQIHVRANKAIKIDETDQLEDLQSQKSYAHEKTANELQLQQVLQAGIKKIVILMQKKCKAQTDENKFRFYIQQSQFRQFNHQDLKSTLIQSNAYNDIYEKQKEEELICVAKRKSTSFIKKSQQDCRNNHNIQSQFDVLDCILHRQPYDQFIFQSIEDLSHAHAQSHAIQPILSPKFNVDEEFLVGYTKESFNQSLFRNIHDVESQKAFYNKNIRKSIL